MREGFLVVILCHKVLRWTFVYAYYRQKSMSEVHLDLFKQWQGDLAKFNDKLHGLLEQDLNPFLDDNTTDRSPFYRYRGEVIQCTDNARKFCGKLLEGLNELEMNA